MRTVSLILAFTAAAVIALPPQWCQIIAGERVACCPDCADDCEDNCDDGSGPTETHCQCGNTPFKQPEIVATIAPSVSERLPLTIFAPSTSTPIGVIPKRKLQQLLCCWRN